MLTDFSKISYCFALVIFIRIKNILNFNCDIFFWGGLNPLNPSPRNYATMYKDVKSAESHINIRYIVNSVCVYFHQTLSNFYTL